MYEVEIKSTSFNADDVVRLKVTYYNVQMIPCTEPGVLFIVQMSEIICVSTSTLHRPAKLCGSKVNGLNGLTAFTLSFSVCFPGLS